MPTYVNPDRCDGRPGEMEVNSPALFGEDKYLGVDRLPVPGDSLGAW